MSLSSFRYRLSKHGGPFADWLGKVVRHQFTEAERGGKPFNREQLDWIERAADEAGLTVAGFGSTLDMQEPGVVVFDYKQFKPSGFKALKTSPLTVGETGQKPYIARSIFNLSAMSYGAINRVSTEAFSMGAAQGGFWQNTGEGGLAPAHLKGGCDLVFQIGTAKYGVRDKAGNFCPERMAEIAAHPEVKMIEIKLSQGAKPGKGGILPALKVTPEIAAIRGIEPYQDSVSPADHAEIHDVKSLVDFINYVRDISEGKPVGFKTSDIGFIQELCEEIIARGERFSPDFITIDGGEGGSGAAPMSLMDNMAHSIREMLPQAAGTIAKNGLKDRIKIIASGQLVLPVDVAWALSAGADFVTSARGFMRSIGCEQSRECHRNTCMAGIATQDPKLNKLWMPEDKAPRPMHYHDDLVEGVEIIAHSCGVSEPRELKPHHTFITQVGGTPATRLDEIYPDLKYIK